MAIGPRCFCECGIRCRCPVCDKRRVHVVGKCTKAKSKAGSVRNVVYAWEPWYGARLQRSMWAAKVRTMGRNGEAAEPYLNGTMTTSITFARCYCRTKPRRRSSTPTYLPRSRKPEPNIHEIPHFNSWDLLYYVFETLERTAPALRSRQLDRRRGPD